MEKFPQASFKMTKIEPEPASDVQIATGKFKMHGIVKEIRMPFTVKRIGKYAKLKAELNSTTRIGGLSKCAYYCFLWIRP